MVKTFFPLLAAFSAEGYEAGNCRGDFLQRFLVRALLELNYNRTIVYDSMAFIYSFGCILSPLAFVGLAAGSVFYGVGVPGLLLVFFYNFLIVIILIIIIIITIFL